MTKWILCSEELPTKDDRYLVTLENGYIEILGYSSISTTMHPKGFYYVDEKGFAWKQNINPVVAWMSLPKAYERDQQRTMDEKPVKHGKWLKKYHNMYGYVYDCGHICSVCGEDALDSEGEDFLTDYCPSCGAKMEEERRED